MSQKPDVTHVDVRYVADLARLALSDDEVRRYSAELDAILQYVAQLSELDVEGIEPTAHAMPLVNVMRPDTAGPSLPRDVVLANAPAAAEGQWLQVPPVLDEDDF